MANGTAVFKDFMSLGQVETTKGNSSKVRWEESGGDFSDGIGCGVPAGVKNGSRNELSKREQKLEIQRIKNKGYNVTQITRKAFPRVCQTEVVCEEVLEVKGFLFPNEIKRYGDVKYFYYGKDLGDDCEFYAKKFML
jgi:hypothetical protein